MNDLVFLEPNRLDAEPFTTTKVIAEFSGVSHRKLKQTMAKHKKAIESFGLLAPYGAESTGGRPETIFKLNEEQSYFVMTLLKNTEVVVEFKRCLIHSFFAMRQELTQRQILRGAGKPIRHSLTDAIRDSGEDERMHGHAYSTYTDLAYKAATGKIARILRSERGAARASVATDFLASGELAAYNLAENRITMLLDMGLIYDQIKPLVTLQLADRKAG